jgi:Protein of unknown function (DUF4232)
MTAHRATAAAVVAGIVAVTLGACASGETPSSMPPPSQPAPSTSTSEPAACPEPGVAIRISGGDAAMGLRELVLSMTNCGDQPYQVNGYPDIQLLDEHDQTLDVQVLHGTSAITVDPSLKGGPEPVTLQPGASATAVVVWRNLVTDPSVVATTGTRLRVAPATGVPAQTLTPRGGVDLGNTGRLGVSPWKAAAP